MLIKFIIFFFWQTKRKPVTSIHAGTTPSTPSPTRVYFGCVRREIDEQFLFFFRAVFVSSDWPKAASRKCRVFRTMREMHSAQPLAASVGQIPVRLFALLFRNKSQKIDEPQESRTACMTSAFILNLGGLVSVLKFQELWPNGFHSKNFFTIERSCLRFTRHNIIDCAA